MNIQIVETLGEFKARLGLTADGILIEEDLDLIETDCDLNERKRRDAEVLCTLAANVRGPCLDLGTSHGRSAFKLATNLRERGTVFTVNILPEQHDKQSGELVTHLLSKGEIGSFFRSRGVTGIEQIYADTAKWQMPPELRDFSLAFVDAAHDTENVLADSRKIFPRVHDGGYIVWHDFNPLLRGKFHWIDASMRGVERFFAELGVEPEIIWLRNSWMAVWRKPVVAVKAVKNSNAPVELIEAVSSRAVSPPEQFKPVRFAWMFPAYSRERVEEEAGWASRISALGYNVEIFGVPCPDGWWPFPKLDAAWKRRDPALMRAYDQVASRLHRGDVLVASGGSMIHPEFVRQLPALSVFTCGDDPESSEVLSHPAAPAFDVSLVGNVACLDLYRSWGCRHVDWLYQAIRPEFLDPTVTEESILAGGRDMDAVMFCERIYGFSDRAQRIERLVREFPQATVRGKGWPGGFVTHAEMLMLMRRARLGWNLHNSIGPCNMRLVTLPALGAMQICDNKQHLGKLFKLDEEIVGFDTIEECVEKTRHYLTHEDERRAIAARGWKRAVTDYTEPKQWEQLLAKIHPAWCEKFSADREANGSSAVEIRSHNSHREAAGVELNPHPAARANETVHPLFPDARVGVAVANNGKNYEPARVRELIHEAIALYTGDRLGFGAFINAGDRVLI
ncbi:MAG: glycosyltransferase, partial [Verrucomicrobia bacterium]|nr:glycosyltransferase [Verrucomicrobiota bacterium]